MAALSSVPDRPALPYTKRFSYAELTVTEVAGRYLRSGDLVWPTGVVEQYYVPRNKRQSAHKTMATLVPSNRYAFGPAAAPASEAAAVVTYARCGQAIADGEQYGRVDLPLWLDDATCDALRLLLPVLIASVPEAAFAGTPRPIEVLLRMALQMLETHGSIVQPDSVSASIVSLAAVGLSDRKAPAAAPAASSTSTVAAESPSGSCAGSLASTMASLTLNTAAPGATDVTVCAGDAGADATAGAADADGGGVSGSDDEDDAPAPPRPAADLSQSVTTLQRELRDERERADRKERVLALNALQVTDLKQRLAESSDAAERVAGLTRDLALARGRELALAADVKRAEAQRHGAVQARKCTKLRSAAPRTCCRPRPRAS